MQPDQPTNLLYLACKNKDEEKALELIKQNYDNTFIDDDENTIIMEACKNKMWNVVEELLKTNCDVKGYNVDADSVLDFVICKKGNEDIAVKIIDILIKEKYKFQEEDICKIIANSIENKYFNILRKICGTRKNIKKLGSHLDEYVDDTADFMTKLPNIFLEYVSVSSRLEQQKYNDLEQQKNKEIEQLKQKNQDLQDVIDYRPPCEKCGSLGGVKFHENMEKLKEEKLIG